MPVRSDGRISGKEREYVMIAIAHGKSVAVMLI